MVIDELTRINFEKAIDDWAKHCENVAHHSDTRRYTNCDSYKHLVEMGPKILPLVREVYEPDYRNERGRFIQSSLVILVKQLVGDDFQIPKEASGKVDKLKKITINWIESNMYKYS